MSISTFVSQMLNINPDNILEILSFAQQDGSVVVKIKLKDNHTICPFCSNKGNIHAYSKKKLNHSTLLHRRCTIFYLQRRYKCSICDITYSEPNPFSSSGDNLTHETKINILKSLKHIDLTYTYVAEQNNVSTTQVIRLFDKYVNIPRKTLPLVLSIDENYFPTTDFSDAKYCCLLMDFLTGEILDVLPDRRKFYLSNYFTNIKVSTFNNISNTSELDNVKYVSMDLSYNFRDIANIYFPNALVCADSFHVLQHLTTAFKNVRIRCAHSTENASLRNFLVKFRFVFEHDTFLDNEPRYNKSLARYINLRGIRDYLFSMFPDLEKAYNLKEFYINFNRQNSFETAQAKMEKVISVFADSGLNEFDEFYVMLCNWRQEIVNSFTVIQGKRINNSYMESKNRLLSRLKSNANGFKNFKRARNRIMYCLNKNDTFTL